MKLWMIFWIKSSLSNDSTYSTRDIFFTVWMSLNSFSRWRGRVRWKCSWFTRIVVIGVKQLRDRVCRVTTTRHSHRLMMSIKLKIKSIYLDNIFMLSTDELLVEFALYPDFWIRRESLDTHLFWSSDDVASKSMSRALFGSWLSLHGANGSLWSMWSLWILTRHLK